MKKLRLLFLLFLLPGVVLAGGIQRHHLSTVQQYNAGGGAPSCDDCSAGYAKFYWHMEDGTIDNSGDTPCGCVDAGGDNTATFNSAAALSSTRSSDGDESLWSPGGSDSASFTASSYIFDTAEGKIVYDVYVTTFIASTPFVFLTNWTDHLILQMYGETTNIRLHAQWKGDGTANNLYSPSNSYHAEGEWLRMTYTWKTAASAADHKVEVCDLTPPDSTSNCDSLVGSVNLDSWTTGDPTSFYIGSSTSSNATDYHIDNIEIDGGAGSSGL